VSVEDLKPLRRTAAIGSRIDLDDLTAILDAAEGFPEAAKIHVEHDRSETQDRLWTNGWSTIALEIHGASVAMPVIGTWPIGLRTTDVGFMEAATPERIVAAIRTVATQIKKDAGDAPERFEAHYSMCETLGGLMVAAMQIVGDDLIERMANADGAIVCEMFMDAEGLPTLVVENEDGDHLEDVHLPEELRRRISIDQPICMSVVRGMPGDEIRGLDLPTVILRPILEESYGEAMTIDPFDPIELMRIARTPAFAGIRTCGTFADELLNPDDHHKDDDR
jgi:hypothetical protein